MTVEASLSHQEEDIVYYDAKADAELVSAPTLAGGRGGLAHCGVVRLTCLEFGIFVEIHQAAFVALKNC